MGALSHSYVVNTSVLMIRLANFPTVARASWKQLMNWNLLQGSLLSRNLWTTAPSHEIYGL